MLRRYSVTFVNFVSWREGVFFQPRTVEVEAHDACDAVVFAEAKAFGGNGNGSAAISPAQRAEWVTSDIHIVEGTK